MQGDPGPQGDIGPQGPEGPPGEKTAIVPYQHPDGSLVHLGLICVEMPEARFEDVLRVPFRDDETSVRIPLDPRFLAICEQDSIVATSAVPSQLSLVAAEIRQGVLHVRTDRAMLGQLVTVRISGLRSGRRFRFPEYSEEQARANTAFWRQAHGG